MLKIGITGGIGSGKTTLTNYLENKGYIVIDADKMSREYTSSGGKAIPYIIRKFGEEYILPDGSMDRAKMRDLVFTNPEAKRILEEGTTNIVIKDINNIINRKQGSGEKIMFFSVPLLFEKKMENDYDQIWAVTADREIKKERVKLRDKIDDKIIDLIISTQAEEDVIISKSDVVIYNNGTLREMYKFVDKLLMDM